jgi:hypothetical protein
MGKKNRVYPADGFWKTFLAKEGTVSAGAPQGYPHVLRAIGFCIVPTLDQVIV